MRQMKDPGRSWKLGVCPRCDVLESLLKREGTVYAADLCLPVGFVLLPTPYL
jgi:hypothetical protein